MTKKHTDTLAEEIFPPSPHDTLLEMELRDRLRELLRTLPRGEPSAVSQLIEAARTFSAESIENCPLRLQ